MNASTVSYDPRYVKTVTMCAHISPACNLKCKYCFRNIIGNLSFDDVARFIDCVLQIYPHADRYIVDMSGSGEPLLRKDLLLEIARYCKKLSNKYMREFLPTCATNGTLLTPDVAAQLQDEGILFGVSLDGTKETHDRNRVFENGQGTFDIVEKNIGNIRNKTYVGAAVTYVNGDLLRSFLTAFGLLPTVSMKPVRYTADNRIDVADVCDGYDELCDFISNKTISGETEYLFALLNGEDYFGKFIKRIVLGISVYGRCDAGIGRFALAGDKKIYCCPPAEGISEGVVGDLEYGISRSKIHSMFIGMQNTECDECPARDVCGGECKIVSYNRYGHFNGVDPDMCKIKLHLFETAKTFIKGIASKNNNMLDWLKAACTKIDAYSSKDDNLIDAVKLSDGKYTFAQLKSIKDKDPHDFENIYSELLKKANRQ